MWSQLFCFHTAAPLQSPLPAAWGNEMNESKSKRRWFRYSLRTLFVLVTIMAVASAWYAH